jgi:hypothetical protein
MDDEYTGAKRDAACRQEPGEERDDVKRHAKQQAVDHTNSNDGASALPR